MPSFSYVECNLTGDFVDQTMINDLLFLVRDEHSGGKIKCFRGCHADVAIMGRDDYLQRRLVLMDGVAKTCRAL